MRRAEDGLRAGPSAGATHRTLRWPAVLLFLGLVFVYLANGTETEEGDALASIKLPFALLSHRSFSFDPAWFPDMFDWRGHRPLVERDDLSFRSWSQTFGNRTAAELRLSGALELAKPKYFIIESPVRHVFVSVFGPVPGLAFLPVVAPFYALDPDLHQKAPLRAKVAKLGGASMIAGTATFLLLIAARYTTRRRALLLALIYGLGTCAWAVSSQNIWQQTVNQALLTAAACFVLRGQERGNAAAAGLLLGIATACRPTGVFVLGALSLHFLLSERRAVVPFLLSALPPLVAIGIYNQYYFGNPLVFAQSIVGHAIAAEKTGSPGLFQTPFWLGALGLLVSPSRGLLVFSPILAPTFWGMARAFRDPAYRAFRPFVVSALLTMGLQCKWFDWWGGHTYGYRPWLDVVPYLVLSMIPVLDDLLRTTLRRVACGVLLSWSAFVQALGAWSYDHSWNRRPIYVVEIPGRAAPVGFLEETDARLAVENERGRLVGNAGCDIDLPYCRYRLWSVSDSIIVYHLRHFSETRRTRMHASFVDLVVPPPAEAEE